MKKYLLCTLSITVLVFNAHAQDFLGFTNSNYSGVTGSDLQPASIVDSRFKTDFNLFGTSFSLYNNYVGLKHEALDHDHKWTDFSTDNYYAFKETPIQNHLDIRSGPKPKSIYIANNLYLPSLMVNLTDKDAIALKWKVRSIINIDGVDAPLADLLYNSLEVPSLWVPQVNNKNLSVQAMVWAEYGFTYARVIKAEGEHFLKAGATVKYVAGLAAAYFYVKDFQYQFSSDSVLSISHGDAGYGHSSNFNSDQNNFGYKSVSQPSFGFDLGVVYEWRPDYMKYKYDMNGEKDLTRKDLNKYKLKVGLSILDIGKVKFSNG